MRTIIVDDEPLAREGLALMLARHPDIELVGEADSGLAGLALVERVAPALMLVDVQMPELDGLELVARVAARSRVAPIAIFVTAYDDFALDAFAVHALDYLVKPVEDHRLAAALERARLQHRLLTSTTEHEPPVVRLPIRDGARLHLVRVDEIDWIEAADYCVQIYAGARVYLHRERLQRLEAMLDDRFVRIHRSRLVNRDRIREVRRDGRELIVVLDGGTELAVARRQQAALRLASSGHRRFE